MTTSVLLVGCRYDGPPLPDTSFEILGLCRPRTDKTRAAFALYEYDVIIINPESYSHFLFGSATKHSVSPRELSELKMENNDYDLDNAFDQYDRSEELKAAIVQGTRVVWLLAPPKRTNFFGARTVYVGYVDATAEKLVRDATLHEKKSRKLSVAGDADGFAPYFESLRADGWNFCLADYGASLEPFATTPEGHALGGRVNVHGSHAWLITPPTSAAAMTSLIRCAVGLGSVAAPRDIYHGIFLSHNSEDKPFVRQLRDRLLAHGVKDAWVDEAEILVGDSLTKKIEEGLKRTKYFGIVLSPRSVKSVWVERELETAVNREMKTGEVVVLPLLYEACDLPVFLSGKMYADFRTAAAFDEGVAKLLRRLKAT